MLVIFEDKSEMVVDVWDTILSQAVENYRVRATHKSHGVTTFVGIAERERGTERY